MLSTFHIVLAMKSLDGNFIQNANSFGIAGINVDGCRIGTDDTRAPASKTALGVMNDDGWQAQEVVAGSAHGRWPANVILEGNALTLMDEQSGILHARGDVTPKDYEPDRGIFGQGKTKRPQHGYANDSGGASRFFKQIKSC